MQDKLESVQKKLNTIFLELTDNLSSQKKTTTNNKAKESLHTLSSSFDQEFYKICQRTTVRLEHCKSKQDVYCLQVPFTRYIEKKTLDYSSLVSCKDKIAPTNAKPMPISIIFEHIRSAHNVGSMLRTCEAMGVAKVYLCGYTAGPEHKSVAKSSCGSHTMLDYEPYRDTVSLITKLKSQNKIILGLETAHTAISLQDIDSFVIPQHKYVFVVGNEGHGISAPVLQSCHKLIRVPMFGSKNSLNVSVCLAMVLWEFRKNFF